MRIGEFTRGINKMARPVTRGYTVTEFRVGLDKRVLLFKRVTDGRYIVEKGVNEYVKDD